MHDLLVFTVVFGFDEGSVSQVDRYVTRFKVLLQMVRIANVLRFKLHSYDCRTLCKRW